MCCTICEICLYLLGFGSHFMFVFTFYVRVVGTKGRPTSDILGGGFSLGSLVMVMEDAYAPHYMLLLRNFMSRGLVHNQPLLYASPSKDPRGFMGTLPNLGSSKDEKSSKRESDQEKGLQIGWQYKKYDENQHNFENDRHEFCNDFDLWKPFDRQFLIYLIISIIHILVLNKFCVHVYYKCLKI
ncbi:hypothetical protein UlMin_031187 [Ulmus minor]